MTGGIWQPAPPASAAALARLRMECGIPLPSGYLAMLEESNGGEGDLSIDPGWIALWCAEDVISNNTGYRVAEYLPGFLGFGSNGGGELLAFDVRRGEPYPIVMVPFIPMAAEDAVQIAHSFEELRKHIGMDSG